MGKLLAAAVLLLALATATLLVLLHLRSLPHFIQQPGARMARLPRVTLWAWERPQFFSTPSGTSKGTPYAIAYLDQTIQIGASGVVSRPRLVPVTFPAGAVRIAVVRIETTKSAPQLDAGILATVTRLLLASANTPGIAAFQVDFDARASERDFYRQLLLRLRAAMPPVLPLSITALASWCAYDDWIHDLPVDEAVPMFFRMEPEWSHANLEFDRFKQRELLCEGSIGLSATGSWPPMTDGRRVYLFADDGWSSQAVESALNRVR